MKPLALALGLLAAGPLHAAAAPIALRDGRIVTVSGAVIEHGTVLIVDGKIAAVGSAVAVPSDATVVELRGQSVYPGLIDGLTTLGLTEISSVPGSIDTTEVGDVNPHAEAWVALNPHSSQLPVARAGGVTVALAAPRGGLVSGQGALFALAGDTPDRLTLKTPAAMLMVYPSGNPTRDPARGAEEPERLNLTERLKQRAQRQEQELRRLADLLADAQAHADALAAATAGKAVAPRPDPVLDALATTARGALPLIMRADSEEQIRGAVGFATSHGLKLIIAGGLEAWRCRDLLREHDIPVLLKVLRLPARRSAPYDAAYANAALLAQAGVRFAIVSDSDSFSRNLPNEAAMAHAFGLAPEAALRAITLSPAEILGVADRLGSIEVGKLANLVVAQGDILDHRTPVTQVWISGVAQSLETRHTQLYRQFKDRP